MSFFIFLNKKPDHQSWYSLHLVVQDEIHFPSGKNYAFGISPYRTQLYSASVYGVRECLVWRCMKTLYYHCSVGNSEHVHYYYYYYCTCMCLEVSKLKGNKLLKALLIELRRTNYSPQSITSIWCLIIGFGNWWSFITLWEFSMWYAAKPTLMMHASDV